MSSFRSVRDPALLDALEVLPKSEFKATCWRVVREGRDPLMPSAPKGRWDDGTFDVLYTSCAAEGAKAEIHYHLARAQPVFPSQLAFHLHELAVATRGAMIFPDLKSLAQFGVEATAYGTMAYTRRSEEYSITQKIGEAAHFLGFDSLVIPNARWTCQNAVLFTHRLSIDQYTHVQDHGPVDLRAWAAKHQNR